MNHFLRNRIFVSCFVALFAFVGYGFLVYAAAPVGGYYPGEILDPDCAPNDLDCLVNIIEVERGSGAPVSTPAGSDAIVYVDEATGNIYSWDGSNWNLVSTGSIVTGDLTTSTTGINLTGNTGAIIGSGLTVDIDTASTTDTGLLTDTDWNTFNNKFDLPALTSGSVLFSDGTTISENATNFFWDIAGVRLGIGTNTPNTSSILDLTSTDKGLLMPRMTEAERDAIATPATGLVIYNTDDNIFYYYDGANWIPLTTGAGTSLIGQTSGIVSAPTGLGTFETWLGEGSGASSASTDHTVFMGVDSGNGAVDADNSNFIGYQSGYQATDAYSSNFIGDQAGYQASNAYYSNFMGLNAGYQASSASNSNFFGDYAGYLAVNAINSTFIGQNAGAYNILGSGFGTQNAANSIFIGGNAGYTSADNALNNTTPGYWSILIGNDTSTGGYSNSIALGANAVNTAANQFFLSSDISEFSLDANILPRTDDTYDLGDDTHRWQDLFLGPSSLHIGATGDEGVISYDTTPNQLKFDSPGGYNFLEPNFTIDGLDYIFPSAYGSGSGNYALVDADGDGNLDWTAVEHPLTFSTGLTRTTNTIVANLIGQTSGLTSGGTPSGTETWLGNQAGANSASVTDTTFIGQNAGDGATGSNYSSFFGYNAGYEATNSTYATFIGLSAGILATDSVESTFVGYQAGSSSSDLLRVTFLGTAAGNNATGAQESIFIGPFAGANSENVDYSNVFGEYAGHAATDVSRSNFFGPYAGQATSVSYSNFIGSEAGSAATNASNSNFLGYMAGALAIDASYSTFMGYEAGRVDLANSRGSDKSANSLFLGTRAGFGLGDFTLDNTATNTTDDCDTIDCWSILIGNDTSTGGFSNSIALGAEATNTATNQFLFGSATFPIDELVMVSTGGTTCATDVNGTACSSDERLKKNITDLNTNILDTLTQVRTVTFNWNTGDDTTNRIGFIAQDIQKYFPELVSEGSTGYLSVNYAGITPILTQAIRELDLKLDNVTDFVHAQDQTFLQNLIAWLGDATNGIQTLFVNKVQTKELCLDDVCVTKDQLQQLLQASGNVQGGFVNEEPAQSSLGDGNQVIDEPETLDSPDEEPSLEEGEVVVNEIPTPTEEDVSPNDTPGEVLP